MSSERNSGEIEIAGPDDVQLIIRPAPNRYRMTIVPGSTTLPATDYQLWSIHNGALQSVSEIRLEISSTQSFDDKKSAFRDPVNLGFRWPLLKSVGAGAWTELTAFLRVDGDHLRLWNNDAAPTLPWPNGDQTRVRRWRLIMRVIGLSREWPIELDVRWTLGTQVLELMECSPSADPTPVRVLPRPLKPVAGGAYHSGPIVTRPRIDIDYPHDFPESARKRVFYEQVRSADALYEKRSSIQWESDLEAARLDFMLSVFGAYAKEACELGQLGLWAAERCESECRKLLRESARALRLTDGGEISSKLQAKIESSEEWKVYRSRLREVADAQARDEPSLPAQSTKARGDASIDFTSEEKRNNALAAYTAAWNDCSEAALARTAIVDTADLSKWKKGSLPSGSEKKARIEQALRNNDPPTSATKRGKTS